jgi:hypothetical protein
VATLNDETLRCQSMQLILLRVAASSFSYILGGEYVGGVGRSDIHHMAGPHLASYAGESAWPEDNRRVSNSDQTQHTVTLALSSRPSVDFCGYWQRHVVKGE